MTLASLMGFDALFTILRRPVAFSLLSEDANGYQQEGGGLLDGQWESQERTGACTAADGKGLLLRPFPGEEAKAQKGLVFFTRSHS